MVGELILTILISCSSIRTNCLETIDELESFFNDCSETYRLDDESFVTLFYPHTGQEQPNRDSYSHVSTKYFIRDKFIVVGESGSYSSYVNTYVGDTPMLGLQGTIEYRTLVELDLSLFPDYSTIIGAGLTYIRQSGSLGSIDYSVVTNYSFDQIDGTTNYTSTYLGTSYVIQNAGVFTINLTNQIVNTLSNEETVLLLELSGSESDKYAQLYSTNATTNYPILYVNFTGGNYGCAPNFYDDFIGLQENCWGYAKNFGSNQYEPEVIPDYYQYPYDIFETPFGNDYVTYNLLSTVGLDVIDDFFENNSLRIIESYNSLIGPNERRIAFRVKVNHSQRYDGDFHFVAQCSDGSWSARMGTGSYPLAHDFAVNAPELQNSCIWYLPNSWPYSSPILYLAYTPGGVS